jgi:hypothetical protein
LFYLRWKRSDHCGEVIRKLRPKFYRPIGFCIVLDSQVPLKVSPTSTAQPSVKDLYRHSTDKHGHLVTIYASGWAVQSIKHYDWDNNFYTMITGWVSHTQNVSFTGTRAQLGVGNAGRLFLPAVPAFQVTWKSADPAYVTKGPFLKIAMPDNLISNAGPAAPLNQPLKAKVSKSMLSTGPPPWRSYVADAGFDELVDGDVLSTAWLGNYTPTGNDLPIVRNGVWHIPYGSFAAAKADGRNLTVDTTNSYRLFTIGILLGLGGALVVALIQVIFSFWLVRADFLSR